MGYSHLYPLIPPPMKHPNPVNVIAFHAIHSHVHSSLDLDSAVLAAHVSEHCQTDF